MKPPLPAPASLAVLYGRALRLYPAHFYAAYSAPMRQAFADALSDPSLPRNAFLFTTLTDLAASLCKEHLHMLRETFDRPALLFNALVLSGIATILALALYAIPQQVLRHGANDPQIQMATDLAAFLNSHGVTSGVHQRALQKDDAIVDMNQSLAPFLIVYNDAGQPLDSTGQLDGKIPTPPAGVFDYVRRHGEERVSWQPILGSVRGVRVAAVVERVGGAQPGFVLAGRSLREVEAREEQVRKMAGLAWLGMLGLIFIGALGYGWITRAPHNTPMTVA